MAITKITIKLQDKELELSLDEARELQVELNRLFGAAPVRQGNPMDFFRKESRPKFKEFPSPAPSTVPMPTEPWPPRPGNEPYHCGNGLDPTDRSTF